MPVRKTGPRIVIQDRLGGMASRIARVSLTS